MAEQGSIGSNPDGIYSSMSSNGFSLISLLPGCDYFDAVGITGNNLIHCARAVNSGDELRCITWSEVKASVLLRPVPQQRVLWYDDFAVLFSVGRDVVFIKPEHCSCQRIAVFQGK